MSKTLKWILISFLILVVTAVIGGGIFLYMTVKGLEAWGGPCGTNDGPFVGVKTEFLDSVAVTDTSQTFTLSSNAELVLENRSDTLSPLISLVEKGKIKWTIDTDVSKTSKYENYKISEISDVIITTDSKLIELNFILFEDENTSRLASIKSTIL